jgi:hypothetical protein
LRDEDDDEDEEDDIHVLSWYRKQADMQLPLHLAVEAIEKRRGNELPIFRLLLRVYPEAANIKDRNGKTPYDIAVKKGYNMNPQVPRLLLRAAPEQRPAKLHELNWAARRMAMFLSFSAITKCPEPTIFAKLRFENRELLKLVVSFL